MVPPVPPSLKSGQPAGTLADPRFSATAVSPHEGNGEAGVPGQAVTDAKHGVSVNSGQHLVLTRLWEISPSLLALKRFVPFFLDDEVKERENSGL